jgi:tRNA threonylcarbamoyladenosine biosynthesis protein TsaB
MKIFACDSTAKTASVALCEDNILLAEFTQNGGNTHSETLLPMTEVLLNSMKTDIDEIDIFAVSEGPGSFTGVRIGAARYAGVRKYIRTVYRIEIRMQQNNLSANQLR